MQEYPIGKLGKQKGRRPGVRYEREKKRLGKREAVHDTDSPLHIFEFFWNVALISFSFLLSFLKWTHMWTTHLCYTKYSTRRFRWTDCCHLPRKGSTSSRILWWVVSQCVISGSFICSHRRTPPSQSGGSMVWSWQYPTCICWGRSPRHHAFKESQAQVLPKLPLS